MPMPPPDSSPPDDDKGTLASVPAYPAPLDASHVPAYLASNPLVRIYLELTQEEESTLAGLAASDAREDAQVALELVASVR